MYNDYTDMDEDCANIVRREHLINTIQDTAAKQKSGWHGYTLQQLQSKNFIPDFDLTALRALCCGPYVLSLAIPYFQHANKIIYRMHANHPNVLQINGMISRHSRRNKGTITQYKIYHHFQNNNFMDTISYCSCDCGSRTAGLCSHMTASLYILYHQMNNIPMPKINKRTTQHTQTMIDLYYYKNVWKALKSDAEPGIGPNDRPRIDIFNGRQPKNLKMKDLEPLCTKQNIAFRKENSNARRLKADILKDLLAHNQKLNDEQDREPVRDDNYHNHNHNDSPPQPQQRNISPSPPLQLRDISVSLSVHSDGYSSASSDQLHQSSPAIPAHSAARDQSESPQPSSSPQQSSSDSPIHSCGAHSPSPQPLSPIPPLPSLPHSSRRQLHSRPPHSLPYPHHEQPPHIPSHHPNQQRLRQHHPQNEQPLRHIPSYIANQRPRRLHHPPNQGPPPLLPPVPQNQNQIQSHNGPSNAPSSAPAPNSLSNPIHIDDTDDDDDVIGDIFVDSNNAQNAGTAGGPSMIPPAMPPESERSAAPDNMPLNASNANSASSSIAPFNNPNVAAISVNVARRQSRKRKRSDKEEMDADESEEDEPNEIEQQQQTTHVSAHSNVQRDNNNNNNNGNDGDEQENESNGHRYNLRSRKKRKTD